MQAGERNRVLGWGQEFEPDQEARGSHRRFQNSTRRVPGEADGAASEELPSSRVSKLLTAADPTCRVALLERRWVPGAWLGDRMFEQTDRAIAEHPVCSALTCVREGFTGELPGGGAWAKGFVIKGDLAPAHACEGGHPSCRTRNGSSSRRERSHLSRFLAAGGGKERCRMRGAEVLVPRGTAFLHPGPSRADRTGRRRRWWQTGGSPTAPAGPPLGQPSEVSWAGLCVSPQFLY